MPADYMETTTSVGFPLGTQCYYRSFDDPSNPNVFQVKSMPAKCGFNDNGLAYCNQLPGNNLFQTFLNNVRDAFKTALNCHEHSDRNLNSFDCKDLLNKLGSGFPAQLKILEYLKSQNTSLQFVTEFNTAYVASNDNCVKQGVTYSYWGGSGEGGKNDGECSFATWMSASLAALVALLFAM